MTKREATVVCLLGLLLIGVFHLLFSQFFPNSHGRLGHDYALFLPKLLDGFFWYGTNGLLAVAWFTPAFCGGIPLLPDPQSVYYSVPQFFSFVVHPLLSVYLTFLLFAGLGFGGFYLLVRQTFRATAWTASLAACLFAFNGFYIHRMLIGHLTYHPFMLIPLIACCLLRQTPEQSQNRRWQLSFDVTVAGVLMAYMFHAGMVNVILPALGSIVIIGLIHGIMYGRSSQFWLRLLLGGTLAACLSLAKLTAALAYLHYFGRDDYALPGADSLLDVIRLLMRSLFIAPAHEMAQDVLVNVQWLLDRHEFEFGVTFVPLLLLSIAGTSAIYHRTTRHLLARLNRWQWLQLSVIVGLLALPVVFNYYTPAWNALLKQLPLFKSSATLLRWTSLYIPMIIVLAALAVEHTTFLRRYQPYVVVGCMLIVCTLNVSTDRGYYQAQYYDPDDIIQAYRQVKRGDWQPSISRIAVFTDASGHVAMPPMRNNVLAHGSSQLLCYEPLFGYRLEHFPLKTLHPGLAMATQNGHLNLKNPVCYVYPTVNGCAPGDHFMVTQRAAATSFTQYQPFPFTLPTWQKAANVLNVLSLANVGAFLVLYLPLRRLCSRSRSQS